MENENLPKYDKHDSTNKMLIADFVKNKLWQVFKAIFSFYHIWYVISDEGKIAKYDKESVSNIACN